MTIRTMPNSAPLTVRQPQYPVLSGPFTWHQLVMPQPHPQVQQGGMTLRVGGILYGPPIYGQLWPRGNGATSYWPV